MQFLNRTLNTAIFYAMKSHLSHLLYTFLPIFLIVSCTEDDDTIPQSPNGETDFPVTVTFQEIVNPELRIWTSDGEIDASGFALSDFMDESDYYYFTEDWYSSMEITFTEDSLTSTQSGADTTTVRYEIISDSIFVVFGNPLDSTLSYNYLGSGSPNSFTGSQGFYAFCNTSGAIEWCDDMSPSEYVNYQYVLENSMGFPGYEELNPGTDTLVVYNHQLEFY